MIFKKISLFALSAVIALLASCAKEPAPTLSKTDEGYTNPYEAGTYEHFKAEKKYPKTYDTWTNTQLLAETNSSNSWLKIELATQRGMLMNGDQVVIDYPISSGKSSHPTPPAEYKILEKIVDKHSNKYGRMLDADGNVVSRDANAFTDEVPEGGRFAGAPMKYWLRFTWDGIGHHVGNVPRYPASHACVRGPSKIMPIVYSKLAVGSRVLVE